MSVTVHRSAVYDDAGLKFLQAAYGMALNELGMDARCPAQQHEVLARTIMRIAAPNENDSPVLAHRAASLMEKCSHGAACPVLGCRLKQSPFSSTLNGRFRSSTDCVPRELTVELPFEAAD